MPALNAFLFLDSQKAIWQFSRLIYVKQIMAIQYQYNWFRFELQVVS